MSILSRPKLLEHEADEERAAGAAGDRGGAPRHQPELDGIRGLAILCVLITHASSVIGVLPNIGLWHWVLFFTTPLWGGVDLFFALSGFLITGILIRSLNRPNYFRSFYARRALRIFPVYYLFLILSLLVCGRYSPVAAQIASSAASLPDSIPHKLSFFVYLQNIPAFWPSVAAGLTGLWGAFWSLAVEEQFYLIWPTLIRWVSLRFMYRVCILALVAGPLIRIWLVTRVTGSSLGLLQFPISRLDGLFGGAALAIYSHLRGKPLPLRWALTWLAVGVAILTTNGVAAPIEFLWTGPWIDIFGISAFALIGLGLIAASQNKVPDLRRALSVAPLTFL